MDAGTISAIAALAVALVALLIAFAQVAQQYAATADLMRKCDSIAYGYLPGKGDRVWVLRQLRFKVVYRIPRIALRTELWPSTPPFTPSYSQATEKLPDITELVVQPNPGEASWVSFCRVIQRSCSEATRYHLVAGDADRCPPDLPVIPMEVSLRDIIIMAITAGMRLTSASSPMERERISMRGRAGAITSAEHPLLGSILHFTPGDSGSNFGLTANGYISSNWMSRLWGDVPVSGTTFDARRRAVIGKAERHWARMPQSTITSKVGIDEESESSGTMPTPSLVTIPHLDTDGKWTFSGSTAKCPLEDTLPDADYKPLNSNVVGETSDIRLWNMNEAIGAQPAQRGLKIAIQESLKNERHAQKVRSRFLPGKSQKGNEQVSLPGLTVDQPLPSSSIEGASKGFKIRPSEPSIPTPKIGSADASVASNIQQEYWIEQSQADIKSISEMKDSQSGEGADRPTVNNVSEKSRTVIPNLKAERNDRPEQIYFKDAVGRKFRFPFAMARTRVGIEELISQAFLHVEIIGPHVKKGHYDLIDQSDGIIILRHLWDSLVESGGSYSMHMWPMPETISPHAPTAENALQYKITSQHRLEPEDRVRQDDGKTLSWFWTSQMNITSGYWATPWASPSSSSDLKNSKLVKERREGSYATSLGILMVMLEALNRFTDYRTRRYVPKHRSSFSEWLGSHRVTYPPYTHGPGKGVVVEGTYEPADFIFVNPDTKSKTRLFQHVLPPLELLGSYEEQVNRSPDNHEAVIIDKLAELASLDSWLSMAGRTPEITSGSTVLIRSTPAWVEMLVRQFEERVQDLDRTYSVGGLEDIREVTDEFIGVLVQSGFSKAEQLFLIVAMIRSMKVALCIALGPSTADIQDILRSDIPVYLV